MNRLPKSQDRCLIMGDWMEDAVSWMRENCELRTASANDSRAGRYVYKDLWCYVITHHRSIIIPERMVVRRVVVLSDDDLSVRHQLDRWSDRMTSDCVIKRRNKDGHNRIR